MPVKTLSKALLTSQHLTRLSSMRATLLFLALLLPIANPLPLHERGISETTGEVPNSEQDDTNVNSVDATTFRTCLQQSETHGKWIHVAAALLQGLFKKTPFSCVTELFSLNDNSETLALLSTVHGDIEGGLVDEQSQETCDSTFLAGLDELAMLQMIEDDLKVELNELVAQWCSSNEQSQESPAFVDEHRDEVWNSEVQGDELKSAVEYQQALLSTVHGDIEGGWVDEQSQKTRDSTILDELARLQKTADGLKVKLNELVAQWCSPNEQSQESSEFVDENRDEVLKSQVQGDELKRPVEYRQVNGYRKGGLDNEQSQETCNSSNRAVLEKLDELQKRLNKRFEELLEWEKLFLEWEHAILACSRVQSRVLRVNNSPKFRENGSARSHNELANINYCWHALLNDKEGVFAALHKQQGEISNIRLDALLKDKEGEFAKLHNEQADKNEELVQYQTDIDSHGK